MPVHCPHPDCKRTFKDDDALLQHRKYKHRARPADSPHDDFGLADLAIEAQQRRPAGERVEDWEEPYLS